MSTIKLSVDVTDVDYTDQEQVEAFVAFCEAVEGVLYAAAGSVENFALFQRQSGAQTITTVLDLEPTLGQGGGSVELEMRGMSDSLTDLSSGAVQQLIVNASEGLGGLTPDEAWTTAMRLVIRRPE